MYNLSIIIPSHNRPGEIESKLKLFETNAHIEFIVIENNSTKRNLEKYHDIVFPKNVSFLSSLNGRVSSARNMGINNATGKYIFFLDDDDTPNDSLLKYNFEKLTGNVYRCNMNIKGKKIIVSPIPIIMKMHMFDIVQVSTFIIEREFVLGNNLFFLEDAHICEDIIWNAFIASTGSKQKKLPITSINYNESSESIMRSKINSDQITSSWDLMLSSNIKYMSAALFKSIYWTAKFLNDGVIKCSDNKKLIEWINSSNYQQKKWKAFLELPFKDKWMSQINLLAFFKKHINLRSK